jgi:hypothetical protein
MTTFKEQRAADLASVFFNPDEFAITATYTPKGGTAMPAIPILMNYGSGDGSDGTDDMNTDATARIMVSDIASVAEGDDILIGAAHWIVDFGKLIDDGLVWQVWMSRVTR